jgi:hypothetical protein
MREVLETPMLMMSHTKPIITPGEKSERTAFPPRVLPDTGEHEQKQVEPGACAAKEELSASQDPGGADASPGPAAATQHSEVASISTAAGEGARKAPALGAAADAAANAEMDAGELELDHRVPMASMAVCAAQLGEEAAFPSLAIDADGRGPTLLLRRQGMHQAAAEDSAAATPAAAPPGAGAAEEPGLGPASAARQATDDPELSGDPSSAALRVGNRRRRHEMAHRPGSN